MTISEYMKSLETMQNFKGKDGRTLPEAMQDVVSIWSNDAAAGYMIEAMQRAGLSGKDIAAALDQLHGAFDDLTVTEAETVFKGFRKS